MIPALYIFSTFACGLFALFWIHRQVGSSIAYAPVVVALFYVLPFHLLGVLAMATGEPLVSVGNGLALLLACLLPLFICAISTRSWSALSFSGVGEFVLPPIWLTLSLLLLVLTHLVVLGSVLSAPPRGFDALWYHLPMVVNWALSGSLSPLIGSYVEFYPGNAELLLLPLIGSLENDSLFGLTQYPWLLLAAIPVWTISRELGADRQTSLLAVGAFLSAPLCLFQAGRFYVDIINSACILYALLFLIRWLRSDRLIDLAFSALASGFALGIKYPALVPQSFIILVVIVGLVRRKHDPVSSPSEYSSTTMLAVYLACLTLPVFFWCFRNAVLTGNPVHPIDPIAYLDSLVSTGSIQSQLGGETLAPFSWVAMVLVEFGPMHLLLPAVLWKYAVTRMPRKQMADWVVPGLLVFALGTVWMITTAHLRFVLYVPALTASLLAAVGSGSSRTRALVHGVLVFTILANSIVVFDRVVLQQDFDVSWNHLSRLDFYGLPEQIDQVPPDSRLLHRGHPTLIYPAFGKALDHIVLASPQGDLMKEITQWQISHVLVRTYDLDDYRRYESAPYLEQLGSRTLPAHHWWGYWPENRTAYVGLFRVKQPSAVEPRTQNQIRSN